MNSARVTGVSPYTLLVLSDHGRKTRAYRCLALDNTTAIAGPACTATTIVSASVGWSCPLRIEAAIGPAPNPTLPVCTNSEVHLLPGLKLEASRRWRSPRLSHYPGVYGLGTETLDDQRHSLSSSIEVGMRRVLHVVKCIGGVEED